MKDFVAIDFETANGERSSVCSVGVVVYRDGIQVDNCYGLIKPDPEWYTWVAARVGGWRLVCVVVVWFFFFFCFFF